jgi:hypothetical protein
MWTPPAAAPLSTVPSTGLRTGLRLRSLALPLLRMSEEGNTERLGRDDGVFVLDRSG